MSSFKKFRIDNQPNIFDVGGYVKHQTPKTISRLSDLDKEIDSILSQDIDEYTKSKLYTQALSKYLTLQKLKIQEEIIQEDKTLEKLKNILTDSFVEKTRPKKKKRIVKKSQKKVPQTSEPEFWDKEEVLPRSSPKAKKKTTKSKPKRVLKKAKPQKKTEVNLQKSDSADINDSDIEEYLDSVGVKDDDKGGAISKFKSFLLGKGMNWDTY